MKKCLVLDLDNTLWGGIVGEDGMEGIKLSLTPPGNAFIAFQQAILDHYDRGIILAINSRNNPADAWKVIREHPNMILKEKHFAAHRINWTDKAANIKELAKELNIGLDSMVFLDDDPTNRDLVRALVPEVLTPDLPADPAEYARFLNSLGVFESKTITDEDKMRGNLYVTERLRKEEEKLFTTKEDFLRSLKLELVIARDDISAVARLAQMTEKTNQFNIDKKPKNETEMLLCIESGEHIVYSGRLSDKFGDYGIVIMAIVEPKGAAWHLSDLLMSCRVFGRDVEEAFFAHICQDALKAGAKEISVSFKKSEKNAPAEEFVNKHFTNGRHAIRAPKVPDWVTVKMITV
ncbi:MAG: HAD-IIIC family phosphatase [Patescibacteria group bacterium]|nr:HAD-IIIC family phosphatase [Patescibacteria group bacterium]MDE1946242.1 HAD-IIIC family phosphatase [Patescibacteria group bacterium]